MPSLASVSLDVLGRVVGLLNVSDCVRLRAVNLGLRDAVDAMLVVDDIAEVHAWDGFSDFVQRVPGFRPAELVVRGGDACHPSLAEALGVLRPRRIAVYDDKRTEPLATRVMTTLGSAMAGLRELFVHLSDTWDVPLYNGLPQHWLPVLPRSLRVLCIVSMGGSVRLNTTQPYPQLRYLDVQADKGISILSWSGGHTFPALDTVVLYCTDGTPAMVLPEELPTVRRASLSLQQHTAMRLVPNAEHLVLMPRTVATNRTWVHAEYLQSLASVTLLVSTPIVTLGGHDHETLVSATRKLRVACARPWRLDVDTDVPAETTSYEMDASSALYASARHGDLVRAALRSPPWPLDSGDVAYPPGVAADPADAALLRDASFRIGDVIDEMP
jgi:hypothetical protein